MIFPPYCRVEAMLFDRYICYAAPVLEYLPDKLKEHRIDGLSLVDEDLCNEAVGKNF